jgi:hypothetical protein
MTNKDVPLGMIFNEDWQTAEEVAEAGRKEKQATGPKRSAKQKASGRKLPTGVTVNDFVAYMPSHTYIYIPTREMWPGARVNARVPPVAKDVSATAWLDRHSAAEQMTWAPVYNRCNDPRSGISSEQNIDR